MGVYRSQITVWTKYDGSPVTVADQLAESIILNDLKVLAPSIDVISEDNTANHSMKAPIQFFLVDPLDGTLEQQTPY